MIAVIYSVLKNMLNVECESATNNFESIVADPGVEQIRNDWDLPNWMFCSRVYMTKCYATPQEHKIDFYLPTQILH